jgi:hypothetical protein
VPEAPVSITRGKWLTNQAGGLVIALVGLLFVTYTVSAIEVHDYGPMPPLSGSRIMVVLIVAVMAVAAGGIQGKSAEPVSVWWQGAGVAGLLLVLGVVAIVDDYQRRGYLGLAGSLLAFVAGPSYLLGVVLWERQRKRQYGEVTVGESG